MAPRQTDLLFDRHIMGMHRTEPCDDQRNQADDDPGAVHEFGPCNDHCGEPRGHGTKPINHQPLPPVPSPFQEPMLDHAGLRQGKWQKHAYGIQWDQGMGFAPERYDEQARKQAKKNDAVGEDQTIATCFHLRRHVPIARQDGGQPGKSIETAVGC